MLERCNSSWGKPSDCNYISECPRGINFVKITLTITFFNRSGILIVIISVRTVSFQDHGKGAWSLGVAVMTETAMTSETAKTVNYRHGCLIASVFCRTSQRRGRCSLEPPKPSKPPKPSWRLPPLNATPPFPWSWKMLSWREALEKNLVLIFKHATKRSTEQTSMRTKWFKHTLLTFPSLN